LAIFAFVNPLYYSRISPQPLSLPACGSCPLSGPGFELKKKKKKKCCKSWKDGDRCKKCPAH